MLCYYSTFPNSVFSDVMLIAWNQLQQEDFQVMENTTNQAAVSPLLKNQLLNIFQNILSEYRLQDYRKFYWTT